MSVLSRARDAAVLRLAPTPEGKLRSPCEAALPLAAMAAVALDADSPAGKHGSIK